MNCDQFTGLFWYLLIQLHFLLLKGWVLPLEIANTSMWALLLKCSYYFGLKISQLLLKWRKPLHKFFLFFLRQLDNLCKGVIELRNSLEFTYYIFVIPKQKIEWILIGVNNRSKPLILIPQSKNVFPLFSYLFLVDLVLLIPGSFDAFLEDPLFLVVHSGLHLGLTDDFLYVFALFPPLGLIVTKSVSELLVEEL